ncbi:D-alanyl-D-alanine carboxypeptidase [Devosia rhodophyticola]|uniref:D-alanyl-D-alanine carboxypeptidase n=1 Tax=Devosia rhodophyticola TaxID=3026423 RepID=A0ABY7YU06_9HYPH|nr:D-alanyl-D-alanine carboxypeptidase family protein [Devosia rhodophyticola]WDR04662.1 D-alanyl-D-alanine carboxypeptidase [Devosia rhodophyticola]
MALLREARAISPIRSRFFVRFAQRLVFIVLAVIGLGAGVARATPMLLVDMDTLEVLYAQDAGAPWHPASLTKLMTAYVTFEAIAAGRISLDTPVTLSRKAVNQAPSKSGLPVDTAMTMKDALYIMLVKSANDVAMAIAETVGGSEAGFAAMMNETAARMGLSATHYVNPNGLDDNQQVTSARDLAILSLYIWQNFPQYGPIFGTDYVQLGKAKLESNNELLTSFAGTTGMKTGFICASGLNMVATVKRGERRYMAVVLGASSARERNERAAELMLKGFSGTLKGRGQSVLNLANNVGVAPVNMRPLICGKDAKVYVKAQESEFPYGLKGQPTNLTDTLSPVVYQASTMGRIRTGVMLPRPRPLHLPEMGVQADLAPDLRPALVANPANQNIPHPRPRPAFLN